MKNRAKCNLCDDIIESTHRHDYVTCKCGEISVDGGDAYPKFNGLQRRIGLKLARFVTTS